MKTLVFSSHVTLDGMPAGFSGQFKLLHMETGQLYVYRVHITKQKYVGTQVRGMGSAEDDQAWWERMFNALATFIEAYDKEYDALPSDKNIYQDGRSYTHEDRFFGKKIPFRVEAAIRRRLIDRELILRADRDVSPMGLTNSETSGELNV